MPAAQNPEGRDFFRQSRKLYRKYWGQLLTSPAFPWKEKLVFSLFILGWLYNSRSIRKA
jgi:hypothetical protein